MSELAAGSLKRAISRNMLLVLVVGDVLGTGIYALVGEWVAVSARPAFLPALALAILPFLRPEQIGQDDLRARASVPTSG